MSDNDFTFVLDLMKEKNLDYVPILQYSRFHIHFHMGHEKYSIKWFFGDIDEGEDDYFEIYDLGETDFLEIFRTKAELSHILAFLQVMKSVPMRSYMARKYPWITDQDLFYCQRFLNT